MSTNWRLLSAIERHGKRQAGRGLVVRMTLGDAIIAYPEHTGTQSELRSQLQQAALASRGFLEAAPGGSVVYVFPAATRAAVLQHSAVDRAADLRRRTWRFFCAASRVIFGLTLCLSLLLFFLGAVAVIVIAMMQRDGGGGGGGDLPAWGGGGGAPGGGGGGGGGLTDIYWYLTMREFTYLLLWNEQERRHLALARQLQVDPFAEQVSCGRGERPGGQGPPPGGGGGAPPGGPTPPPSGWFRIAEEEDDSTPSSEKEDLPFLEAVFAFVFGRGDRNADLELRRVQALGRLLRGCNGCVFAEQVAPFLDTYLLIMSRASRCKDTEPASDTTGLWHRLWQRVKHDGDRDHTRMHEGYMLPVCARFGGHAEASDDGRLVYVFDALRITVEQQTLAAPPPVAPPLYERPLRIWDGGEKQPIVVLLGLLNLALVMLFRSLGGLQLDVAASANAGAAAAKRARAMGRRAGGGFAADAHGAREVDPAVLAVLRYVGTGGHRACVGT